MSVAFRRDSDEEHREPRFERPIPPGPNLVTRRGLDLIAVRVAELEAGGGQDDAARRDLRYWRTRLATAQLAPAPPAGQVGFGSRVAFCLDGAARTIDIVGDDEADPAYGRVAFSAPLARALMGAGVGETVDFAGAADAIEVTAVDAIGAE